MLKAGLFVILFSTLAWSTLAAHMPGNNTGERFAPVTLVSGQELRAVISNVRIPNAGESTDSCGVLVSFFGSSGSQIGSTQTIQLAPGESDSVTAGSATGMVRVIISIAQKGDPSGLCAVKGNVEVFDSHSGSTLFLLEGASCLGAEPCATPLDDQKH